MCRRDITRYIYLEDLLVVEYATGDVAMSNFSTETEKKCEIMFTDYSKWIIHRMYQTHLGNQVA